MFVVLKRSQVQQTKLCEQTRLEMTTSSTTKVPHFGERNTEPSALWTRWKDRDTGKYDSLKGLQRHQRCKIETI